MRTNWNRCSRRSRKRFVMLAIHPIIQVWALVAALYAFCLGVQRFRFLHLHKKTAFKWKRHVVFGEIALGIFLLGMLGGMTVVYLYWHGFLITGSHGNIALVMAPCVVFGLVSGLYMNVRKKKRRVLPLVHGLNNLLVLILGLCQVYTGWWVYKTFALGR